MAVETYGRNSRERTEYQSRREFLLASNRDPSGGYRDCGLSRRGSGYQVGTIHIECRDTKLTEANPSPLISILSHLNNNDPFFPAPSSLNINILYSVRLPKGSTANTPPETILDQILFLPRIRQIMHAQSRSRRLRISIELFITDLPESSPLMTVPPSDITVHSKRIKRQDLQATVIGEDAEVNPKGTVCYLCGPPKMTDEFVEILRGLLGGEKERVLFEKWW